MFPSPKHIGVEEVLLQETLSDSARFLGYGVADLCCAPCMCKIPCCDFVLCCWQVARPRAYVKILENAVEYNRPTMCCPVDGCVQDHIEKVYFDKILNASPFKANCCTPYHCCWCIPFCGEVAVVAPCDGCNGCLCQMLFPCYMRYFPGLQNAQAFVDFMILAKEDFKKRKSTLPVYFRICIVLIHPTHSQTSWPALFPGP